VKLLQKSCTAASCSLIPDGRIPRASSAASWGSSPAFIRVRVVARATRTARSSSARDEDREFLERLGDRALVPDPLAELLRAVGELGLRRSALKGPRTPPRGPAAISP